MTDLYKDNHVCACVRKLTVTTFDAHEEKPLENIVGEG